MQKTWVQSLDQEDPLEKGMETHSSIKNACKFFDTLLIMRGSQVLLPLIMGWPPVSKMHLDVTLSDLQGRVFAMD